MGLAWGQGHWSVRCVQAWCGVGLEAERELSRISAELWNAVPVPEELHFPLPGSMIGLVVPQACVGVAPGMLQVLQPVNHVRQ